MPLLMISYALAMLMLCKPLSAVGAWYSKLSNTQMLGYKMRSRSYTTLHELVMGCRQAEIWLASSGEISAQVCCIATESDASNVVEGLPDLDLMYRLRGPQVMMLSSEERWQCHSCVACSSLLLYSGTKSS